MSVSNHFESVNPWLPSIWRVRQSFAQTLDTVTIDIEPEMGEIPLARPGQFNMIYFFGIGEIPISLSSISAKSFGHTIRSVGKVSAALASLKSGSKIGIRGPYGTFWDSNFCRKHDVIVVAGGVGLAPLKPLVEEIMQNRRQYNNIYVLYGARDPDHVLFSRETSSWNDLIDFRQTVDFDVKNEWEHSVGSVPTLLNHININPQLTTAFVCGPEVMMRYSIAKLIDLGITEGNIFLSMERNMKCAIGFCGHCQFGGSFICKDGPVFSYNKIASLVKVREI